MTLLEKVKQNLLIDYNNDDDLISRCIAAAVNYAESYQHVGMDFYSNGCEMSPCTEQAVIMLASHYYESRDGSTGGFFADSVQASEQVTKAVNALLRLDRDWKV